jgi:hypothetical protein
MEVAHCLQPPVLVIDEPVHGVRGAVGAPEAVGARKERGPLLQDSGRRCAGVPGTCASIPIPENGVAAGRTGLG